MQSCSSFLFLGSGDGTDCFPYICLGPISPLSYIVYAPIAYYWILLEEGKNPYLFHFFLPYLLGGLRSYLFPNLIIF